MRYKGAYIRKSTALYLLQENLQISNDRLWRVRKTQPAHLFSSSSELCGSSSCVKIGDLCLFRQLESEKVLLGRVIQFSYLEGNKKEREFSGCFVDMSIESFKGIGVYANWFARKKDSVSNNVDFEALDLVFKAGYLSMEHYVARLEDSCLLCEPGATLSVKSSAFDSLLNDWNSLISYAHEFYDE